MKYIKLSNSAQKAIVDDEDYEWLINLAHWGLHNRGYAWSKKTGMMHRLILEKLCRFKAKEVTDHKNRNKLDNRKENLRICSQKENSKNKGKSTNNTSGYIGVSFCRKYKKWGATICNDRKRIHVGYFENPYHAAIAHDIKAKDLHKEFCVLNFSEIPESDYIMILNVLNNPKKRNGGSKYKGVSWDGKARKWVARITFHKKVMTLKRSGDEVEAAKAYDKKCLELFKGDIKTNFNYD